MNRYWDLSEKDRAELSSEQVEGYLSAALMEAGVVRVEAPVMLPTDQPDIPASKLFTIKAGYSSCPIAFKTADDAAAAMALAVALDNDYVGNRSLHTANGRRELTIETIDIYSAADIANHRKAAEQAAANQKANEQATKEYREACKAVDSVVNGVWDDWHKCRRTQQQYQRIVDTFNEYTGICDGNRSQARVFLEKAFPLPAIHAAMEWFGLNVEAANEAELVSA